MKPHVICSCASFFTIRGVHKEGCPSKPVYVPAPPFHEPAHAVSQSPVETTTSDWEERAGVWARTLWRQREYECEHDAENAFIDFIREERTQAKKEVVDELREIVARQATENVCGCAEERECHQRCGKSFNDALNRVLALLPEQESK